MPEETKSVNVVNLPALKDVQSLEVKIEVLSSRFQEMIDRFDYFMKTQEERVRNLETNCNREERWGNNKDDHDLIWAEINKHDARITTMELGKCPRAGQLTELDTRVKTIEIQHQQESGQSQAFMSTREMIGWGLTVTLGVLTLYNVMTGKGV